MKRRKLSAFLFITVLGIAVSSGCGAKPGENVADQGTVIEEKDTETKKTEAEDTEKEGTDGMDAESTERSGDESQKAEEANTSVFSDVSNYQFWFSSGVGGWGTSLVMQPDGTFWGQYHDSDMGDATDDYPNGTQYWCDFYGKFTEPVQVNAYTYQFQIDSIRYNREPGEEEIIAGCKYIYSEPYGLDKAEEICLYLPDAPVDELPQEYMEWVKTAVDDASGGNLGFYGLYNVAAQDGFSSSALSQAAVDLNRELAELEAKTQEMNERLQSGNLTQIEMNRLSGEMFRLWDDELNSLWGRLKDTLDSGDMEWLTKSEQEWIKWKEQSVKEAGSEMEGGSMQPLLENDKAAELTRERVYELADWLH